MNNGNGVPYMYNYINVVNGAFTPSTQHLQDSKMAWYFRKYLLQKVLSVFEWKMPDTWAKNYFLYTLYCWGFIAVINTDKFGVIPQGCGLQGYDIFYQPTTAVITNPLLTGILTPKINKECTVIKFQPDYGSIMDIVNYYAGLMALCSEGVTMNIQNSKLAYVFGAGSKAGAESFKKLYDNIASGEPAVVFDKELLNKDGSIAWDTFSQNVGQNYIADRILSDMRKIENMFNTDVGIANANTDKKERLIVDEVNANNEETRTKAELWLEELQEGCAKTRELFGIEISVDWRAKPVVEQKQEEGEE